MKTFNVARLASLGEAKLGRMLCVSLWLALFYAAWLWLAKSQGEQSVPALIAIALGFLPPLLYSVYDYRYGLLLTIVTAPWLMAPIIPHSFTQGFGDWFAIATITGFICCNARPKDLLRTYCRWHLWLLALLAAAIVSLVPPLLGGAVIHLKYGLADIAGITLNFLYLIVLVSSIQSRSDFLAIIMMVLISCFIVALYALAGTYGVAVCYGGYYGGHMLLTLNQSLVSTFGDPNYFAAYVVTALPLLLLVWMRTLRSGSWNNALGAFLILVTVFFIQAAMSRAAMGVLMMVYAGWLCISRFRKKTRIFSILFLLMIPVTYLVWWYPACTCPDRNPSYCPFGDFSELKQSEDLLRIGSMVDYTRTPKAEGGWGDKTRMQILEEAVELWRHHPITGVGIGLMGQRPTTSGVSQRAHNVLLTTLAEQGLLGAAIWGGWVHFLVRRLWRHRPKIAAHRDVYWSLALAGVVTLAFSMFMDFYRMLWIWQLAALILAWPVYMMGDDDASRLKNEDKK